MNSASRTNESDEASTVSHDDEQWEVFIDDILRWRSHIDRHEKHDDANRLSAYMRIGEVMSETFGRDGN